MYTDNPRYKLTQEQIKEAQRYFKQDGWRVKWISTFFGIAERTVIFHIRHKGWIRRTKVLMCIPEEVAEIYRQRKKEKYEMKTKMNTSYSFLKELAEEKKASNCTHVRWIKRCSLCGEILGSDATHNH
jgi:hypothetical protein